MPVATTRDAAVIEQNLSDLESKYQGWVKAWVDHNSGVKRQRQKDMNAISAAYQYALDRFKTHIRDLDVV